MSGGAANQLLMFGAEALLTALLLLGLFRLRARLGLSPLYVTLGVFQPIQVLLASSIYVEILPGLVISPGSAVMFTATLFAILLVYIREDAIEARKVIYGIVVANLSLTLLLLAFGAQLTFPGTLNLLGLPRAVFSQGARVMVTGTLTLFADVLLIIFVFEALWRFIPRALFLRIYCTMAIILAFDTLVFATGAFYGQPHFGSTVLSGIVGKLGIAALYTAVLTLYLRFAEPPDSRRSAVRKPFEDIFSVLTYRQKYEIERDGTQMALRNSEEQFRAIFNATNDAIVVHDPETGAIVDVNRKMCEMFAMTREEALQAEVGEISAGISPYTQEDALGWMRKTAAGEPQLFEWRARDKAGRLFWVEVNMIRAALGPAERIIVSVREITDRKLAQEALRASERRFRETLENIQQVAVQLDLDGRVTFCNDFLLHLTGYNRDEVVGRNWFSVFRPEVRPEVKVEFLRGLRAGEIALASESPIRTREGAERLIRFSNTLLRDGAGRAFGATSIGEDITERRQAEEELGKRHGQLEEQVRVRTAALNDSQMALMNIVDDLNQKTRELENANTKLKELDRLKSMFIASMSHELRTPLNSIIGFSGILLQGMAGDLNKEQKDQLERVFRAGKHLLSLITDVIDIAKIESGKIQAYAEEFTLRDVVFEACESLKVQIDDKHLELRVELPSVPVALKTDRRRLLQCLLNYLGNAVKFTEKGAIVISARALGERVTLSVADTGIGIKASNLGLLFGSFVRLDSPLKMTTPGTGLGLYLTKKIVTEMLGGEVAAASTEGVGSTFSLTIPRVLPAQDEPIGKREAS